MATQTGASWRTKGTLLQACNCDYGCPCNFNAPPTFGDCQGTWVGHIDEGSYGDANSPDCASSSALTGPRRSTLVMGRDSSSSTRKDNDAQRDGLAKILTGQVGGPFGILAGTISKLHGPDFMPIDIKLDGANSTVSVGDSFELEIKNPVTGAEAFPGIVLPQGLLYRESTRASCKTYKVNAGVSFEHSGKDAAFSPFEWSGP